MPIYFVVTWLRNKLYDWRVFKSLQYDIPIICVGNLSVGGTGKTPMIEYLIQTLKNDFKIATLSRGYKRATNGFIIADETVSEKTIGDEPYQFHQKFKDIIVSVDSDRRNGISKLMELKSSPQVILLDDAYQHRRVQAKFNILLTPYNDLYVNDILLPTGNLREPRSGAKRADVICVTKCPDAMTEMDQKEIIKHLRPRSFQNIFFSWIVYSNVIRNEKGENKLGYLADKKVTLVTGIANPKPLLDYLKMIGLKFEHLNFKDHHEFTSIEIDLLKAKECILTTEKDFMRLSPHFQDNENLFYLPIEIKIDKPDEFHELVKNAIE